MRHVKTNKSVMILTYKIVYISETIEMVFEAMFIEAFLLTSQYDVLSII